jgi:hypothetical protein
MAPGVRFIDFEIVATGVFFFECALRSLTCCLDQATRLVVLFVFLRLTSFLFERVCIGKCLLQNKYLIVDQ